MAVVRRSSDLSIPADQAFALAQKVELFQFVVAPFIRMRSLDMGDGVTQGSVISGRIWWFGVVPSWTHHIRIVRVDEREISTNEHGGPVSTWNHRLRFEALDGGRCRYTDEIELGEAWHDAGTRLFAELMFRHRHRRWATLAAILS